ncbi:hypothetical protein MOC97_02095 [Bacillus atrophaeus]|uniref:hypothetical protein n=2 Tax=Bacillus subtilis group TaxID=653685 RepID=UPI00227E470C|nr:hypothetical protein [Bacillus atrophaeus]MCY8484292.1 hypothetical protein [Bacillus atrophaeus]
MSHHHKEEWMMKVLEALREVESCEQEVIDERQIEFQNSIAALQELGELLDDDLFGEGELEDIISQARSFAKIV